MIGHSQEWHDERRKGIGGSDATIIMSGDDDAIYKLWQVKRGEADGDDLSDVLAVQMGSFTEPFNLAWFEHKTGQAVTVMKDRQWSGFRHCELDGIVDDAIFDAKHSNERFTIEDLARKYIWQLHHNMDVTGKRQAILSSFFGNAKWDMLRIDFDLMLGAQLEEAETRFWECVKNGIPPVPAPVPDVDIAFDDMIEEDMTGSNEWADLAFTFINTESAAKQNAKAKDAIKKMVGRNVKLAHGHGIEAKRNKRGAITIGETK